jgi:ATP-dependent exoDNAse (exonuclease V) beta subunit
LIANVEGTENAIGNRFGKVVVTDEEFEAPSKKESLSLGEKRKAEGIAYHAFLEAFDFGLLWDENGEAISKEALTELMEERLTAFTKEYPESGALLDQAQLVGILSNPVFYTLRGKRLYKEQQFLASLPIRDTYAQKTGESERFTADEEMIFQGAIDLLAVDDETGRVCIIDYKYSSHDKEYLLERYRLQLELYRLATAKTLKIDPSKIDCVIVNIRLGFQVDVP